MKEVERIDANAVPWTRYVVFGTIAAFGCAADLLSKRWIFAWRGLPGTSEEWWLIEGYVGIETALNPGALFGLGAGHSNIFAGLSVVAFIGIVIWLFYFRAARDVWLTVALGCVTAGILGNLYDRLGLWNNAGVAPADRNSVRDWILFEIPEVFTWPNFNLADSLLVCGAILLVVHAFWQKPAAEVKVADEA